MSKHTPWTKEEAENEAFNRMVYGKRLSPHQQEIWLDALAWAAKKIDKCETVSSDSGYIWKLNTELQSHGFEAKLIGIKEVEK